MVEDAGKRRQPRHHGTWRLLGAGAWLRACREDFCSLWTRFSLLFWLPCFRRNRA